MPNKFLITEMDDTPPQITFADFTGTSGNFSPTAANDLRKGVDVEVDLDLLNLTNTTAHQSAKADLTANFAERYAVVACIEMQVAAATDGRVVEFYWSASPSATAGTANMGGASGVSSTPAYTGYSNDLATAIRQLIFIGNMVMTDDAVDSIQIADVGDLFPPHRYGSLIVKNECGQTICETDNIEAHIVFNPIIPELQ